MSSAQIGRFVPAVLGYALASDAVKSLAIYLFGILPSV
jgi:hypothetical protein